MRNPGGYLLTTYAEGGSQEADSFTCQHCNKVVFVKPFADPADMGGRCTCCDGLICPGCVGKDCDVMEKKLLRWEARKGYVS